MVQHLSQQNSTSAKAQTETVVKEVTDIRSKITGSLDIILENVSKRTKQIRSEADKKESVMAESVEQLKALYDKKLLDLESLKKYGTTPDVYICSRHLETEVKKLEDDVLTLDSTLETSEVGRPILDVLNEISEHLESDKMPKLFAINRASYHQPTNIQLKTSSALKVGKFEQHTVSFTDKCSPTFTGITVDDDGTLILSDSCSQKTCGYLCVYNPCLNKKQVLLVKQPYNSTVIDKQTVAMTMNYNKRITVVSFGLEMRIEKSLDTKYQPRCITSLSDGKVAISWTQPPGFSIADISGSSIHESQYFTQDSDGRKFQSFDFMAINEPSKLVIQPCHHNTAVYCFDFTGKSVFKYTNNLKYPQCVAVDSKTGSVYVCDKSDACIHQLSARGQPISLIRHTDLKNPLNVCYDERRKCLWVTHASTYIYDIITCFERA